MDRNRKRPSQCHFVNEAYEPSHESPSAEANEVQGAPYVTQVSSQTSPYHWYHINVDALPFKLSFLCLGFMEGA